MATREQVLQALETQKAKFSHEKIVPVFRSWSGEVQYCFPDLPLYLTLPLEDGRPGEVTEARVEGARVYYEMSSDTFLAIANRELSGLKAYTQKKVKVRASLPDLMKMQKLDSL
jgi:hypothetical protein